MDFLFPRDDRERLQFKESALQIGFEELTAECTASINLLQPHDRLSVLLMAWKKIGDYLTHNQYTPSVGNVVNWVGRHTLELWFGRDWISCPAENKTTLIEYMMKVYPTAFIAMCPYSWPYMFSIYRDPWMVDYLNINFQRMNDPELSDYLDTKDSDFILQEGLSLIFLRIVNMFDFNMMKLVKHMCRRLLLAWHDRSSSAHRSVRAAINATECIDYVRHMYLITFYETSGMKDLHYVLECVQRNMHCNATEYSHLDRAAQIIAEGLLECKQTLMEFLIAFLSKIPERQFSNTFGNSVEKYKSFLTEYLLRKIHNRKVVGCVGLLPADGIYENLIKMFIKKRESSDDLMKNTPAVSERLFAGVHDLKALKFSYDKIKSLTRVEWYTTKITLLLGIISEELNILEDCKYTEGRTADELIKKEQDLAAYYRDLSKLLGRIPVLEQEAWLTTFSLYPCREYLDAVTKCGSRNLRAIKKQAIKLKVISELKPLKPSDNGEEHNLSSNKEAQSQNVTDEFSAVPEREEFPCTSVATSESNCSVKEAETPTGRKTGTGKAKRPLPTKAIKPINKLRPKSKLIKKPNVQLVARTTATTPIPKKLLTDCKDKNTAEVLFAASAGADDKVSYRTEETIKYPGFALINSVTDTEEVIRYTDYDGEVLAQYKELTRILSHIRLQHSNYDDLLALLIAPRYKRLTWATCWKNLRKRCRFLFTKDTRKKQLVEQYLADANERLTHLQIDYEKYKNKPQIDYGSIEDGYECFETESGEERGGFKRGGKIKRINIKPASQDELDEPDRSEDDLSETESLQSTTERIDEEQLIQKFEILVDADQNRITSSDSPQDGKAHYPESGRISQEALAIKGAKAHIKSNVGVQGLQRHHGNPFIKKNPSVLVHRLQVSSIGQVTPRFHTASIPSVRVSQIDKELQSIQVTLSVQSSAQLPTSTPTEPTTHRNPSPAATLQESSSDQVSPSVSKTPAVHLEPSHVQSVPTAQVVSTPSTPIVQTPPSEADTGLISEAETLRVLIPKVPLRTYSRHRTVPNEKLVKSTTGLEGSGSKLEEESTSKAEVGSGESSKSSEELILSTATADTNAPTKKVLSVPASVDKLGEKRPLSDPLSLEFNLDSGSTESLTLKETTYISEQDTNSTEMARDWRYPHPHPPIYEEDPGLLEYAYEHSPNQHGGVNPVIEPEYQSPHLIGSRFAQDLSYAAQQLSAQTAEFLNQAQHMSSLYYRPETNTGNRGMMRTPQEQSSYMPNHLPHYTYGPYPRQHYRDQFRDSNSPSRAVVYADPNPGAMISTYIDYQSTNPVPVLRIGGPVSCVTICHTIPITPCHHQGCSHSSEQSSQQRSRQNRVSDRSDSPQEQERSRESSQEESEESVQEEPEQEELQESTPSSSVQYERGDNEYISFSGTEDPNIIFLNPNINQSQDRNTRESIDLPEAHTIPYSGTRSTYADAQGTIPRPAYEMQTGPSDQSLSHVPAVDINLRNYNICNRNNQTESGVAFAQSLNQALAQTSSMASAQLNVSGMEVVPFSQSNQARSQISYLSGDAQLSITSLVALLQSQLNYTRSQSSHEAATAQLNVSRLAGLLQSQLNQARSQTFHVAANAQLNGPRFAGVSQSYQSMGNAQLNVSRFAPGQLHQVRLETSHMAVNTFNEPRFAGVSNAQLAQAQTQAANSMGNAQMNVPRFAGVSNAQIDQEQTETAHSTSNAQFNVYTFEIGQKSQARPQTSRLTANAPLNETSLAGVSHAQLDQAHTSHSTGNYDINPQSNVIPALMTLAGPSTSGESSVDPQESVNPRESVNPKESVNPRECGVSSSLQTVELIDSDTESDTTVAQHYPATHISHSSTDVQVQMLPATHDNNAPSCSRDTSVSVALPGPSRYVPSEDEHVKFTNFYRSTQSEPGLSFRTSQSDTQPSHSRADRDDEFDDDISAQSCSSGLRSSSGFRPVRQTGRYTYIPPELNTVQIVKPSGTTRINRMTVELGQGMRNIIPNDRRDVLRMTSGNRFPNPRWRPFFSSMLKRKLIFVPSEEEAEEILNEYSSQRRNGKWATEIITFGLKEDTPEEEITDETVIINLTNPKYEEEADVDTEEWSTQRTGHTNQSRPEIEGAEAGVRYNLDPPIHFFLGIPSPAYSLSIVCPFRVQGANAPSEILTVDPEFSYKIYMFLREDDFAWELLSLTPTQAPSNHQSDDDDDDNQLDFQIAPQGDRVDVEVVNINNGVRTQAAENMDVNGADDNGANDGDDGNEGEPPEGGEGEAREADNNPNDDQGEDDEEESDPRTDGEQESEGDDEEDGDGSEDDEVDEDRENVNEENTHQAAASNIQPEVLPQRCHNLSDSDSDSTERSDIFMRNSNNTTNNNQFLQESRMRLNQGSQMQEFEHTMQAQEQGAAEPEFENQNVGDSGNSPGTSDRNAERDMQRIPGTSMATMEDKKPYGFRSATKRGLENSDSDSDSEILVRRSGRYALKVYGAGSRTRVMEGRPGPSTSRTRLMEGRQGPSTSGRKPMPTKNPVPEPDIICLSSSSTSDDNVFDHE